VSIAVVLIMVGAAFLITVPGPALAQDNELMAYWTADPVTLDGTTDEVAWATSIPIHVEATRLSPISVEIRAVYDEDNLYMAIKWEDQSWSVNPDQWLYTAEVWTHIPNQEDMLSFLWNTDDAITAFDQNKQGCEAACHNDVFETQTAGEVGDLWQWRAARTNPTTAVPDVGWMDDMALTDGGIVPDEFSGKIWEENSVNAHDGNESTIPYDKDFPKWEEGNPPPNAASDPEGNFMFRGFETEVVDLDPEDGTALPGYMLSRPSMGQDRADISAKGNYDVDNKIWTVELMRKLVTGNDGDVAFDNLLDEYDFGLAIFDNQGGGVDTHFKSELVTLGFELPELAVISAEADPTSPIVGDTVNISMTVENLGQFADQFTVGMFLDNTSDEAVSTEPFDDWETGENATFNFTWDTTTVGVGEHTLIIKADSDEIVLEKDEENNIWEIEVWVYPPISKFKASKKDPEEGSTIKLTATVDNPSDVEANITLVFFKGDEELHVEPINVTAGGSKDVIVKWKANKKGKYTFTVHIDGADNTLMEVKVNVKEASPGPGLILAVLAIGLIALAATRSRRRGT
jgi:hypothetical protein